MALGGDPVPRDAGFSASDRSFIAAQRRAQGEYFQRTFKDHGGHGGKLYRLASEHRLNNLAPDIAAWVQAYFEKFGIAWHQHASHGLSSQACCLNFLAPFATRPDALARLIGDLLGIEGHAMLPIEIGPDGHPAYVGFEWIGESDYLGEWPKAGRATRGANVTSADAVVRFAHDRRIETLLIEWKYTEAYGQPIPNPARADGSCANDTRVARYADKVFAPHGPIRADLGLKVGDFFWEPFYQLMRQQALAWRMEKAKEAGSDRVRVLHISPAGNRALHAVTAPALRRFGDDAFEAFRATLAIPADAGARFIGVTVEDMFAAALQGRPDDLWARYLLDRYDFLTPGESK